jgi:1-acyl-sn-glycerol-3-phosphate acyltransferase
MQTAAKRLGAKRNPMGRRTSTGPDDGSWPLNTASASRRILRIARAARGAVLVLAWTIVAGLIQLALLALPGRGKVGFARIYWSGVCKLLGLSVRMLGRPAGGGGSGRPVVFVSNHSSWLDIAVLGGTLEACFIAKREIARWPVINLVARLGRTVFVDRRRASTGRERDGMRERLAAGDNLILFPEGTTSDGSRVLSFRSAFFSVAERPVSPGGLPPLVQPVSVVYDRISYLPTGRASRTLFAWYGDMDLGPHVWRVAQHLGLRATMLVHAPMDPSDFASRKELAKAVWQAVADGAATLRQNRPPPPIEPVADTANDSAHPAFA